MIEYFFKKWQPEPAVKPSAVIRGRVICIIVLSFQSGLTPCVLLMIYVKY